MKNILDTLITDRVKSDVDRALYLDKRGWAAMTEAERAEYSAGPKGGYCYIDLNRVKGAMEYLESLMNKAGVTSGYEPVLINHKGCNQKTWTDDTWIEYDKPRPTQWAAHLENVAQYWEYVQEIEADVIPLYNPNGTFRLPLEDDFSAGDICTVTKCSGLVRLILDIVCDPDAVTAKGTGWKTARTANSIRAEYVYPGGMFLDVQTALDKLRFACTAEDGIFDVSITFRADLRHGAQRTLGTCVTRWSSHIIWGVAGTLYETWGGTRGLDWWLFERGYGPHYPFTLSDGSAFLTKDGERFLCLR